MRRLFPPALVALIFGFLITGSATATTYYIAANGSDSNIGTSNTTPWLHAPGMPNCTGTCASTTPKAGDKFIFRGGDTWHFGNSSLSPYSGNGTWSWNTSWSGSSANCNLDASAGTITTTSCVYIGTDQTWYSGSSFTRPVLNADNPRSTGFPSSCVYNYDSINIIFSRASYIIWDDFEYTGYCTTSGTTSAFWTPFGTMTEVSNSYVHGWTTPSSSNAGATTWGGFASGAKFVKIDHNIFDGSDSSGAGTLYTGSLKLLSVCTDLEFNVIRYVSNGCVDGSGGGYGPKTIHDNLFEYMYNPAGGHGNVIEILGPTNYPLSVYNNVYRHSDEGVGFDLNPANGSYVYFFNNTIYDNANAANCVGQNPSQSGAPNTMYFYNNTVDSQANVQGNNNGGCNVRSSGGSLSTVILQNNHFINYSTQSVSAVCTGNFTCTDNGNEVWQSESAANNQGYTASNAYQPTSTGGATYHSGMNNSTICPTFSSDASLCDGTTDGVTGSGNTIPAPFIFPTPKRGSTWDAGAYQFASSSSPNPPTGLAAVVQ